MCSCVHNVCMCVQKLGANIRCLPQSPSTLFLGTESLTELGGYDWLDWLVREPQGFSSLCLSTIVITGAYHCTCFFVLFCFIRVPGILLLTGQVFHWLSYLPSPWTLTLVKVALSKTETEAKRNDSNSETKRIKREPRTSESSVLLHTGSVFMSTLQVLSPKNKNNSSKCFRRNLRNTKTRHGGHISDTLPIWVGMERKTPSLHLLQFKKIS